MKISIYTATLLALLGCPVFGQPKADPYKPSDTATPVAPVKSAPSPDKKNGTVNLSTCLEVFSIPMEMAAAMHREHVEDLECYRRIIAQLKDESVKQEVFIVLRSRSGEKATNEAIVEQVFPTEYDKPTVPASLTVDSGNKSGQSIEGFYTPSNPTAFETRNTGEMLEIETTLSDDKRYCHIRMIPEQVLLAGYSKFGQGTSRCEMPIFETRRTNSGFTVAIGMPFLVGTLSRPSDSGIDPDAENKVSLAFITVKTIP